MTINPEIIEILKESKIDKSQGLLCLLGIYYGLDTETTCSEETIKAINITKIVEKDYSTNSLQWNISLFEGIDIAFSWVKSWTELFGKVNKEREGSWRDATKRMKDFFKKYPEYRRIDVLEATHRYLANIPGGSQYCMHSHKFIFDGAGAMKKSTLLQWCERVTESSSASSMKGRILR